MGALKLTIILFSFFFLKAQAAQNCIGYLARPIPLRSNLQEVKRARVREVAMDIEQDTAILEILKMFGQLRNQEDGYNSKRKTFLLGKILYGGYSLEMSYEVDKRHGSVVYNYSSLDLVHPDGYKESLNKRPLNSNLDFSRDDYSIDGPEGEFEVVVPKRLEGKTLQEIIRWGKRLEFLDPSDLRALSNLGQLRGLYLKYFKEDQKDLYTSRARKEYSKILFSVATSLLFVYFSRSHFHKKEEGEGASDLFALLLELGAPLVTGIAETDNLIASLEAGEPPKSTKQYEDSEAGASGSRTVTVTAYSQAILVVDRRHQNGKVISAAALLIRKGEPGFGILERALRKP